MEDYVKVIRFANEGFNKRPYNTTNGHSYSTPFLDIEIKDLTEVGLKISEDQYIEPQKDDMNWLGCFVFLDSYDNNLLFGERGILLSRKGHKKNIGYLNSQDIIWVRNMHHSDGTIQYVKEYSTIRDYVDMKGEHKQYERDELISRYSWVKMTVSNALKRIELRRKESNRVPEWLSEAYLTHEMIDKLHIKRRRKLFGYL